MLRASRKTLLWVIALMMALVPLAGGLGETAFSANSESIAMIEVNQVMSYGVSIEDGSYYAMESFVAGKETMILVAFNEQTQALADGSQRLTVVRDGVEVAQLLPEEMDDTNRLFFYPRSLADVDNWAAGHYTFTYTDDSGNVAERSVTFSNTKKIKVLAVPVRANYGGNVVDCSGEWKTAIQFTAQCYPLAQGAIEYVLGPMLDLSDEQFDLTTDDGMYYVWESLANLQTPNQDYELILGFVRDRQGNGDIQGYTYGLPANIITESDGDMQPTVAHEIAHCYSVGDEYPGGAINDAVNPAPYGMEGSDWEDRDITVQSTRQFVQGGNDVGNEASGTVVPLEQFPINIAEMEILYNNVTSFMGSGSSDINDYWITSAIWEQLFKSFVTSEAMLTQSQTDGGFSFFPAGSDIGDEDAGGDGEQPAQEEAQDTAASGGLSGLALPCALCGEGSPLGEYAVYALCLECGQLSEVSWNDESFACEYCGTESPTGTDNLYLCCPRCEKLTTMRNYVGSHAAEATPRMKASAASSDVVSVAPGQEAPTYRVIDIKGLLSREGVFTPSPFFSYQTDGPSTAVRGDYSVVMKDAQGKVLSRARFNVAFTTTSNPPRKLESAPVNVTANYPEATASITLLHGDEEIFVVPVSENAPAVAFAGLVDEQEVKGQMEIAWEASDADGDGLTYELWYCTDEGEFTNIASNLKTTGATVDFDTLPGSDNAYLYLYACDGTNTSEIDSPYLHVGYKAPEILTEQAEIPEVKITEQILLDTDVYDMQDGWLYEDEQLAWTLNGREYMSGSTLWVFPYELAPGEHVFTLTATNAGGMQSAKNFTFRVLDDESALPDDWSREDVKNALSNGFIAPLKNVDAAITRGRFAELMATLYYTVMDENAGLPDYEDGVVTDCGSDDYSQFLMASLGVMEAPGGKFSPNDTLTEEQAMRTLYEVAAKGLGTDDGTVTATEDLLAELEEAGVINDREENTYQADKAVTGRIVLVRLSRLFDYFFSE